MINKYLETTFSLTAIFISLNLFTSSQVNSQTTNSTNIKEIEWGSSISRFELDQTENIGQQFTFKCSPAPIDFRPSSFSVWGTDNYTTNSSICKSALNAGMINIQGGIVTLSLDNGQPFYAGSERNGAKTWDHGATDISFSFIGTPLASQNISPDSNLPPEVIKEIDWRSSISSFDLDKQAYLGRQFTFECSPAPIDFRPSSFSVWGTDNYTTNSSICKAALNAGLITIEGGEVTLRLNNGQTFYAGSERNGSKTWDHGATNMSFAFIGNPVVNNNSNPSTSSTQNSPAPRRPSPVEEGVRKGVEDGIEDGVRDALRGLF